MDDNIIVKPCEVKRFIEQCMNTVGLESQSAKDLAENLVAADIRGHFSHGLNRLDLYASNVKDGIIAQQGTPILQKETGATGYVNGNNIIGPTVGKFCMELAIKKAQAIGIGLVVASRWLTLTYEGMNFLWHFRF